MPESTLKKKHVAICYHRVREACASGMIQIAKEDGATNLADVMTKSLPGPWLRDLIGWILYWARSFAFHEIVQVPPAMLEACSFYKQVHGDVDI